MKNEQPNFGPFEAAFSADGLEVPGYLHFLNLNPDDERGIQLVIDRIARAMTGWETDRWLAQLMGERNWRPQLVGAVTYLLDRAAVLDRSLIWRSIDVGSWVTPQLVVTAFFSDVMFTERARERLDTGCRTSYRAASGKMASSLLALTGFVGELAQDEVRWRASPILAAAIKEDAGWDHSGQIANRWMARIGECFAMRGSPLTPAVG